MKVTDPEIIKAGEKDLIDSVKEDLDWDVVKEIIKKQLNVTSFKTGGGEIVVHNNQIAFRLDLALKLNVSLMFDRDGSYIPGTDETSDTIEDAPSLEEPVELDLESDDALYLGDIGTEDADMQPIASDGDDLDVDSDELGGNEQILDLEQIVLPDDDSGEDKELDLEELSLTEEASGESELELEDISLTDEASEKDELDLEEISLSDEEGGDSELELDEISLVDEGTDESLDDDIDDILKESREFWEQKKDNE